MKLKRFLFLAWLIAYSAILANQSVCAQAAPPKVAKISVAHVGPHAASDPLILANIRSKEGEAFSQMIVNEDIKNLYGTGFFASVRVDEKSISDGIQLTYVVEGKPILKSLKITGNKIYSTRKLMKLVTSKVGQPLDERKLFTDSQEIQKKYEKAGYQKTVVKAQDPSVDQAAGTGTAVIEITEAPKVKIKDVVFDGAAAFGKDTQKKLRKVLKTRRRWMFSWITGSGILKEDEFQDDKDRLVEHYQSEGYIDFEIKDVKFDYISPKWMILHFIVTEGRQYKIGAVEFKGNKLYTTNDFLHGLMLDKRMFKVKMVPGLDDKGKQIYFSPVKLAKDIETLKDFYGAKGYIDAKVTATKIPNVNTGTMDIVYEIEEREKSSVEKIEIRGNTKTKDRVIRRELSIFPGETYDMVRVKLSKTRIEGLDYFEKVDTQSEDTDVSDHKNLVINVEEKNTGNVIVGAGFSSVDSVIGFVELTQGNFDLFKPPTFTGAGQKYRMRAQIGTERQDYEISFIEPWFMGRKLALGVDLFYRDLGYVSLNDIYNETDLGGTVSLTRALGSDFLIGRVSYTLEQVGIDINKDYHLAYTSRRGVYHPANMSQEIYDEHGERIVSKMGYSIAYDTRNNALLPDKGQRTELATEVAGLGGDSEFYKLELRTGWYFRGFAEGHVLEVVGRTGVADSYGDSDRVPIFDRYFLGGMYSLRGYRYREVGPRDEFKEPLGGDTFYFGSVEYSIPIIERVRLATFYDIGNVFKKSYSFDPGKMSNGEDRPFFYDDVGIGLRLNLPIGPLRLDYGFPLNHDPLDRSSGRFQFGVGYFRQF
jgi:outer membrane protein insertion porin family